MTTIIVNLITLWIVDVINKGLVKMNIIIVHSSFLISTLQVVDIIKD